MDTAQLLDLVARYRENREFITNEETTKMALVIPFLRHLGYDTNSPREVRLEFTAEFTHGDGKKLPDRMDFAIFDKFGVKALFVIETKPLGSDLDMRSPQLARYLSQMRDLRFGILTDGCRYLFFADLEDSNVMDKEPFFSFSLADPDTDWSRVAQFLSKFSRDAFNAETLVTDAENSRYRQAMTSKIASALRDPASDKNYLEWLTKDVYKGKRTAAIMDRLGTLAKEAVEPALFIVLTDNFFDQLKDRFQRSKDASTPESATDTSPDKEVKPPRPPEPDSNFWGPIRREGLFAGKPVPEDYGWISKIVRGIGISLELKNNDCSVSIYVSGEDRLERRAKILSLLPADKYPHRLHESTRSAVARFPVMDKGRKDPEHWDEARKKLVGLGEDIYNKIKEAGV